MICDNSYVLDIRKNGEIITDKERVYKIVSELSAGMDNIQDNQSFSIDLGFDSLRLVELFLALEENFELEFSESDIDPDKLNTVADIFSLLKNYLQEDK